MATVTAIISGIVVFWNANSTWLSPLMAGFVGWLFPSPLQKSNNNAKAAADGVSQVEGTRGNVDGLG